MQHILDTLNPVQKEAVLHTEGPLVIFAGAGSGKTRIITTRIAWLLEQGVMPWQILAVTFTNKASKEMKERVANLSPDASRVHIGTFHASCARWLREFSLAIGFQPDFTIYDEKDSLSAIKTVLAEFNTGNQGPAANEYKYAIGKAKVYGWLPSDAKTHMPANPSQFPVMAAEVYQRYQEYLAQCNAMDFNDLLMNMVLLLRRNKEVREKLQKRYRYIMVDEYQDTNPTQFALISELTSENKNLCVVGDDDQSIYSWRGADPGNILGFKNQFPDAKEIRLEQNYRCSSTIIDAASKVIKNNRIRAEKTLWTDNPPGQPIIEEECYDGDLEAAMIADHIQKDKGTYPFADVAVFYRTNAQSRLLEENLRRLNIPYKIYGALRFYDRAEIKDMLAWIRLIVNPSDDVAFQRIVNTPTRGIGAKALDEIKAYAAENECSLNQSLKSLSEKIPPVPRVTVKLKSFASDYQDISRLCLQGGLDEVIETILEKTNYLTWLKKKDPDQAKDKIANIHELGAALSDYQEAFPEANLSQWLQDVSLSGSEEESVEGVSLMTLHSAKGLEFERVFIAGMEDRLLPHANSMDQAEDLEEERRLFYVGMTRAKKRLTLSYARRRRIYNQWVAHKPSRFLREIPASLVQNGSRTAPTPVKAAAVGGPGAGAFVNHPTFGKGTIESVENGERYSKALVNFLEFGKRMVPVHHLKQISG